jgi:Ca2+-binding RTX toxin-like protein
MTAGDLTGDGLAEVIVIDKEAGTVQVLMNATTTRPIPLTVTVDGNTSTGNNFVNAQTGQVAGRVFADHDRDGRLTGNEPGLAGATVFVDLNRNGRLDRGEPRMVTGPHGLYSFAGLPAGHYHVRVIPPAGHTLSIPGAGLHTVRIPAANSSQFQRHFGTVAAQDVTLYVPADTDAVRLVRRGDRLEVLHRVAGVIASYSLAEVHSITVTGPGGTFRGRLVLDLASGGAFALPGGITVRGDAHQHNALRIVLGNNSDRVHISDNRALINDQLRVQWNDIEVLAVDGRGGADVLSVQGTPLRRGTVVLNGGTGDDTYALGTRDTAIQILDADGIDTLDFRTALAGVWVDLNRSASQLQRIDSLGNRLMLDGSIENCWGSSFGDVLRGNLSRNILIGGPGADVLFGQGGDDLLIGGSLAVAGDPMALQRVAAEWNSPRPYAERVQNLIDGTGSAERNNSDSFLNDQTLHNDQASDELWGGAGQDWFLGFATDRRRDRKPEERFGW